jgi:hypothetical protein
MGGQRGRLAGVLAAGMAAALLAGALPAAASAADYCVAPNTTCGGTNVASFQQAIDLADNATDADRIFLGAATYTAPSASGYSYNQSSSPVEIVGKGEGSTILTSPNGGTTAVLYLEGGGDTSVHDLTIRLPQNAAAGLAGLSTENTASRIEVVEDPTQTNIRVGVELWNGGTLEDSSVAIGTAQNTTAVLLTGGGGTVRHSVVSAHNGVGSHSGGTVDRSRVIASGAGEGVEGYGGLTTITSSVIRLAGATGGGYGIYVDPPTATHPIVNADGVTIVGPNLPGTHGAMVDTFVRPAESGDINLTDSIIRGFAAPLEVLAEGTGKGNINASYSDYDPSGNATSGANATITQANVSNVGAAGFVDAAAGDYHLLPGSPLVDTGNPAISQGLDLEGDPLVSDGNGDGIAQRDMGAYELQSQPAAGSQPPPVAGGQPPAAETAGDTRAPLVSGFKAAPALFAVARRGSARTTTVPLGTHFRYTLSEDSRVTLTIRRTLTGRRQGSRCVRPTPQLRHAKPCTRHRTIETLTRSAKPGVNSTRFSGRIGKRTLRPGRYRAIIRATDTAGNHSAPRATSFRIAAI